MHPFQKYLQCGCGSCGGEGRECFVQRGSPLLSDGQVNVYLKDENWPYENPLLDKVEREFPFWGKAADKYLFLYQEPEESENKKNQ